MKKGLLFLVLILASAVLFAATFDDIKGDKVATVTAYFNLLDSTSQYVRVGFSENRVTESNGKLSGESPITDEKLGLTVGGDGKATNTMSPLYLYAIMYTNLSCDLKLSAKSMQGYTAEKGTSTDDHLGFTVTGIRQDGHTADVTEEEPVLTVAKPGADTGTENPTTEAFITRGGDGQQAPTKTFGCYKLEIVTDPVSSGTDETTTYYSTEITATIAAG